MNLRLTLIESNSTNPYRNLALENWLLDHVAENEVILYLWQNQHTVVIGKNQNAWKECNISIFEADDGRLARRLSGGGAVYHDLGNMNFTFLAQKPNYDVAKQLDVILRGLQALGIQAERSGRNDILVDGRKVSGNAFYEHAGRCYHHGTVLMQVDGEKMAKYLNVSKEKLQSKGVSSVKSRVLNLVEVCPDINADRLKRALSQSFEEVYGGKATTISPDMVNKDEWDALEGRYEAWEWKYGRKFNFDRSFNKRFPWGQVDVELQIKDGRVYDAQVYSDALLPDFIDALTEVLPGTRYDSRALAEAVRALTVSEAAQEPQKDLSDWLMQVEC